MNYLDIIIAIPLIYGIYKGFTKGLVAELASLLALVGGIYGGVYLSDYTADFLSSRFTISEKYLGLIAFVVTFIVIVLAVVLVGKLITMLVKAVALGLLNRLTGAIFGFLKFALILSFLLVPVERLNRTFGFISDTAVEESILFEPVRQLFILVSPNLQEWDWTNGEKETRPEETDRVEI